MIIIAIGANLAEPLRACEEAVCLIAKETKIIRASSWYKTAPWPISDQPWYVNGVIEVATTRSPEQLMDLLLELENQMGRLRPYPNSPRIIDLDLIDYNGLNLEIPHLTLPHPRMQERSFVLRPLHEIAPNWQHPLLNLRIEEMLKAVSPTQTTILYHAA